MASGTGLFAQNEADFDAEMLAHLPIERSQIPELCDATDFSALNPKMTARWPQLKNTKWFPALATAPVPTLAVAAPTKTKSASMPELRARCA
jgi:sugar (pentulose or hexulose) kinase